jgi:hypothetical protein
MQKSRFSESQVVATLKEADAGMKVSEVCREHGISLPAASYPREKLLVSVDRKDTNSAASPMRFALETSGQWYVSEASTIATASAEYTRHQIDFSPASISRLVTPGPNQLPMVSFTARKPVMTFSVGLRVAPYRRVCWTTAMGQRRSPYATH